MNKLLFFFFYFLLFLLFYFIFDIRFSYFVGRTFVDKNPGRPLIGGGDPTVKYNRVAGIYWDSTVFPNADPLIKDVEESLTSEQFLSGNRSLFDNWTSVWCIVKGKYPYLSMSQCDSN